MIVQRVDGLEWHDGWLASIVRIDDGKFYVACAVAMDWDSHRVRFALGQIPAARAALLLDHHGNSGFSPEFNGAWKEALACGPIYLVDAEPREGSSLAVVEATPDERERLKGYTLPLVELASSEAACSAWLKCKMERGCL